MSENPVLANPVLENPVLENPVLENPVLENPVLENPVTAEQPRLRVVAGNPAPDELAALVVVLASRAATVEPAPARPSRWPNRAGALRAPMRHGRRAWSASIAPSAGVGS